MVFQKRADDSGFCHCRLRVDWQCFVTQYVGVGEWACTKNRGICMGVFVKCFFEHLLAFKFEFFTEKQGIYSFDVKKMFTT